MRVMKLTIRSASKRTACGTVTCRAALPDRRMATVSMGSSIQIAGLRANPAKLLLDPYARALTGTFHWSSALFDHQRVGTDVVIDTRDSAPFVPKSIVTSEALPANNGPSIPWSGNCYLRN